MLEDNIKDGFVKRAQASGVSPEHAAALYKTAHPLLEALKDAAKFTLKHPGTAGGRLLKGTVGAGMVGVLPEMVGRTMTQQTPGADFEIKTPTTSGSIQAAGVNTVANAFGVPQALSNVGKGLAEGALSAPSLQKGLDKVVDVTKNINDTVKSPGFANTVDTAKNTTGLINKALSTDPHQQAATYDGIANTVRHGMRGAVEGISEAMVSNPYALPAAIGGGAAPLIVYDLMTKKKREERAKLDKALLAHLNKAASSKKKVDVVKEAGFSPFSPFGPPGATATALSGLQHAASGIKDILTKPITTDMVKNFFHHTPPPVPLSNINTPEALRAGAVPFDELKKLVQTHPQGQSLMNNLVTRNLGRAGLITATAAGGYGAGAALNNELHNPGFTQGSSLVAAGRGLGQGLAAPYKAFELAVLKDRINRTPIDVPEQVSKAYSEAKGNMQEAAQVARAGGVQPPAQNNQDSNPGDFNWKPYAGVAAGIAIPYAAYKLYQMLGEKKLNKLEQKNKEVKDQIL